MKFTELAEQLQNSDKRPMVTFTKGVENLEGYPEANMRCHIVSVQLEHDDVYRVRFDYTAFDEFNKAFESSNYYDRSGNAVLTAREANQYKMVEDLYVMADGEVETYMTIEIDPHSAALYKQYRESKSDKSYVQWLEDQIKRLEDRPTFASAC